MLPQVPPKGRAGSRHTVRRLICFTHRSWHCVTSASSCKSKCPRKVTVSNCTVSGYQGSPNSSAKDSHERGPPHCVRKWRECSQHAGEAVLEGYVSFVFHFSLTGAGSGKGICFVPAYLSLQGRMGVGGKGKQGLQVSAT